MLNEIIEAYPDEMFTKADGFDDAIIGVEERTMRLIYSVSKCLDILEKEGMSEVDAIEHFGYNVSGTMFTNDDGELITPIWCNDLSNE